MNKEILNDITGFVEVNKIGLLNIAKDTEDGLILEKEISTRPLEVLKRRRFDNWKFNHHKPK